MTIEPVPGKIPEPPSLLDGMSKQELKTCALSWLDKAKQKHREARFWRNRALTAEARLEMYDARERSTTNR